MRFAPRVASRFTSGGRGPRRTRGTPRAKTPTVLQMEAVECGAAALAIILGYFKRIVPLEELRVACGVSRDGSKASNVLRAARTYGLVAKGYKREPAQLRDMPMPMIVHWNFNHFLVLEGFRNGRAYLNDPASGPTVVSEAEFDEAFTGVALVFQRGPDFVQGGEEPSLLRGLQRRVAGSKLALTYMILAGLALLIPGLITPTFSKVFVDNVLVRGLRDWLTPLLLIMGATVLVHSALVWIQQHYLLRFETKLALESSGRFFWHVLRLPVAFFTQRYAGEIGNRVGLNDRIARLLAGDLATTVLNIMVIAFYAVLMLQYDVVLTVIGVATALLNMAALQYVSRRRTDLNRRLLQDRGKAMGTAMGGLQTIETLKATGTESDFFSRWAGQQAKVVNAYQRLELTTQLLSAVPPVLLSLNTALILGVGGLRVMDGRLSMGMLVAFQSLMLLFLTPINRMVGLGSTLQEVKGDMGRLDDVLRAEADETAVIAEPEPASADELPGPVAVESEAGAPAVKLSGYLELRDVTFGYSRLEAPLIEGFDLTLKPGNRVALVGRSGCGKTTVAKLVAGLYEPWQGEILFDGRPRREISRSVMTNSLALVDQDIFLFEGTIRENVTLWDATVPEADLLQAARDASIHEDVTARSGGYASRIGEGGSNFSGGQRQRLEIARALAGNPSIVVLDEATSALDPATEQIIDEHLRRRGCTCLIIAHRLSTIRDCDEIIVLDHGHIAQRGTHAELSAVPGAYRDLIASE
ncbi:MAG TPA: NHLP family bacteriocin export ABC transporter peptidase/permease/ATPase subunit [Gemmatimonadaceae bacterium]|nr:NHLP family bacteriocin export ABC transporter peptidase/permease/ATPase subunit [Gemmatimonadaceae bacterium]